VWVDDDVARGDLDLGDEGEDERDHDLAAVGRRDDEDVLAGVQHVRDGADRRARDGADGEADEVSVAEPVGVVRGAERGRVDEQPRAAELAGYVPVVDALEPDKQLAGVPAAARHDERAMAGRVGVQPRALREPKFGLVGADTDHDRATDPVRTADPADGDLHGPLT